MLAFDREYGLPDGYFVVAQLARAILAPWAKEPVKAEDFVPYFAPDQGPRCKQTVADHKANFARFARKAPEKG